MKKIYSILSLSLLSISFQSHALEQWRGLNVEPESRCSKYDKKGDYPYSQSVEDVIVDRMNGKVYGPYSGRYFKSDRETDIEHMVATSEAHDSGLCSASKATKAAFASDQINLTLASPEVNRCGAGGKCGYDASDWLPEKNKCWFTNRIVEIKTKYSLSVDRSEANALESVLSNCDSFDMVFYDEQGGASTYGASNLSSKVVSFSQKYSAPKQIESSEQDALSLYDDNKNGRITCSEARAHGIAPVSRDHSAYPYMRDGDGDGVVCE